MESREHDFTAIKVNVFLIFMHIRQDKGNNMYTKSYLNTWQKYIIMNVFLSHLIDDIVLKTSGI